MASCLPVTVDRNQLEMALLNLAVNARDAMSSGGVLTLRLTSQDIVRDRQLGLPAGRFVVIAVSDTGEGMDEETLAKAVEPFFSTKAVGKGTGLGLSMVFGLAKQSGGALSLESNPGAGTTARLWLPIAGETRCIPKSRRSSGPKTTERAKILLVDDDALIAGSSVALLEDLGHEVTEVRSAREAIQLLEEGLPADLLITDHAMPDMTGMELADEVRRMRPDLAILLATGYAEIEGSSAIDLPRLANLTRSNNLPKKLPAYYPKIKMWSTRWLISGLASIKRRAAGAPSASKSS